METRRCAICGDNKPLDQFNVKVRHADRTIYDAYCRPCRREYRQKHYQANKQQYYRRIRERERRLTPMVDAAKARPCADCGNQYAPWKMDFDHVSGKKVERISQLTRQCGSIRLILAEIAKCEVVCALCHRDRTHFRMLAQKKGR
ncbi:MAG TPA: hypothetical protein VMG10_24220 [Gemmataceae bacterium]|nr:hypothetical protein [Gemmataceae bacterium]